MIEDARALHLYWIEEREKIRTRRERGAPRPWSTDSIFQRERFCHVRRRHDKGTVRLFAEIYPDFAEELHLWFAVLVSRTINNPDTLGEIKDCLLPFDPETMRARMKAREERGETLFSRAYKTSPGRKGQSTVDHIIDDIFAPAWAWQKVLLPRAGDPLDFYCEQLVKRPHIGDFGAGQIIADLKQFEPLRSAPDFHEFVVPGPGSEPGLRRILGQPINQKFGLREFRATIRRYRDEVQPELERIGVGDIDQQDFQGTLCEARKYFSLYSGERKSNRVFAPGKPVQQTLRLRKPKAPKPAPAPLTPREAPAIIQTKETESMPEKETVSPFDPARLRLDQTFTDGTAVKKLLTVIPVRKPDRQDFIRVHPDPAFRLSPAAVIEFRDDREMYVVDPSIAPDLTGEFASVTIYTAINRQGVVFLWPVKLPIQDGRGQMWSKSAEDSAGHAMKHWVRVTANMSLGAYEVFVAQTKIPEPEWPSLTFVQLLEIAFRDKFVNHPDHPVILRLRGA